ncbi:hypothetical protein JK628_23090 (plasmid) [Shewanella sp. KX20019]|uniref:phage tail tape measure C-terminal domain-containing protein n=1 Tax=Shewanella sp. KX20019 TaxID=2803864 RepID=UPI001925476E|nr:phage tail tape measure C-terminal domain-containing protein [Shewanella sp. KX20019]QQX82700.1 hypothetical protein JK628_23090 [Shewanella sp. KX20019]
MAATNNLVMSLSLKSDEFKANLEKEKAAITKWHHSVSRQTAKAIKTTFNAPLNIIKNQLFSVKGMMISAFSAAGIGHTFKKISDSVKEMKDLARTSRLTTDEFQRLSFAASTVGVEASKVADFMNDALLKINEYAMEGSGEGANIVKMLQKAGYALKDIKDLKGEALFDAISDAAEKTGIDVDTLTRYLDELASDPGVDLASVFTYDKSKFNKALAVFGDLDIALSDDLIKNTDDTREAWTKLSLIIEKFSEIFYASLGPVLTYIGTYLTDVLIETARGEGGFDMAGKMMATKTIDLFKSASAYTRELIGNLTYSAYKTQEFFNAIGADFDIIDDPFEAQRNQLDAIVGNISDLNNSIADYEEKLRVLNNREGKQRGYYVGNQEEEFKQQRDVLNSGMNKIRELKRGLLIQKRDLKAKIDRASPEDFKPKFTMLGSTDFKFSLPDSSNSGTREIPNKKGGEDGNTNGRKNEVEKATESLYSLDKIMKETFDEDCKQAVESFGSSIEESFVDMMKEGQMNFSKLANEVLREIQRLLIKAMITAAMVRAAEMIGTYIGGPIGGYIAGEFARNIAKREEGGPVIGGETYLVGEKGTEVFSSGSSNKADFKKVNILNNTSKKVEIETRHDGPTTIIDIFVGSENGKAIIQA